MTTLKPIGSNVTELHTDSGHIVLFSYQTPVAALMNGVYYRTSTKYSVTTTKHINKWLEGMNAKEVSQNQINKLTA